MLSSLLSFIRYQYSDYSRSEKTRKGYEYLTRAAYEDLRCERINLHESLILIQTGDDSDDLFIVFFMGISFSK